MSGGEGLAAVIWRSRRSSHCYMLTTGTWHLAHKAICCLVGVEAGASLQHRGRHYTFRSRTRTWGSGSLAIRAVPVTIHQSCLSRASAMAAAVGLCRPWRAPAPSIGGGSVGLDPVCLTADASFLAAGRGDQRPVKNNKLCHCTLEVENEDEKSPCRPKTGEKNRLTVTLGASTELLHRHLGGACRARGCCSVPCRRVDVSAVGYCTNRTPEPSSRDLFDPLPLGGRHGLELIRLLGGQPTVDRSQAPT